MGTQQTHPVFGIFILHTTSSPLPRDRVLQLSETHVYPHSGGFGPERARWVATCFPTAGGERNHLTPDSALIFSQQISPEKSISHQLGRLIVRLLADAFNLGANNMPGGTSNLSKYYGHSTPRYDPAPLTKHPPDHLEEIIRDKGTNRCFGEELG